MSSRLKHLRVATWRLQDEADLQSIRQELFRHNIKHMLIELSQHTLAQLPPPYLFESDELGVIMIVSQSEERWNGMTLSNEKRLTFSESELLSLKSFHKVVLLDRSDLLGPTTDDVHSPLKPYVHMVLRNMPVVLSIIIALLTIVGSELFLLPVVACTGVVLMSWLLVYKIHPASSNVVMDRLCSLTSSSNCDKEEVELFGLKFEVLGGAYFLTVLISLFFSSYNRMQSEMLSALQLIGWIALPSVGYALYKNVVSKNRCPVCLITITLFFVLFFYLLTSSAFSFDLQSTALSLAVLLVCLAIFSLLDQWLNASQQLNEEFEMRERIQGSPSFVHRFFHPTDDYKSPDFSGITFGEVRSNSTRIDFYAHVGCKHCIRAFEELCHLVRMNDNFVLHLYIRCEEHVIDQRYYSKLTMACQDSRLADAVNTIRDWKNKKHIDGNPTELLRTQVQLNNKVFDTVEVKTFPHVLYSGHLLPAFIDYPAIKTALAFK